MTQKGGISSESAPFDEIKTILRRLVDILIDNPLKYKMDSSILIILICMECCKTPNIGGIKIW